MRIAAALEGREHVLLADLMEGVALTASLEARARGRQLSVTPVEPGGVIDIDRQLLTAALVNLIQNAFKFSPPGALIAPRTDVARRSGRVFIRWN